MDENSIKKRYNFHNNHSFPDKFETILQIFHSPLYKSHRLHFIKPSQSQSSTKPQNNQPQRKFKKGRVKKSRDMRLEH